MNKNMHLYLNGKEVNEIFTFPAIPRIGEELRFPQDTNMRKQRALVTNVVYFPGTNNISIYAKSIN